tara:strand:- start:112 stop:483 length:372 start_codon:yes stop_codon:yes gene_type:complete
MATAQTYKRQFNKTFKIVEEIATEYYELLGQEKIGEDDNFICTYSDLEKFDSADFKWLELQDKKIENNNKNIELYENLIKKLKEKNEKIDRQSRNMRETIKNGNGIDKDYCKYLLECEKEKNK